MPSQNIEQEIYFLYRIPFCTYFSFPRKSHEKFVIPLILENYLYYKLFNNACSVKCACKFSTSIIHKHHAEFSY